MNIFKSAVIVAAIVVAGVVGVVATNPVSAAGNECTVKGTWAFGKNISVNGNTATAKFTVDGKDCTTPVTFASWIRVTAEGINDQKLYKYTTKTFGPGVHTLSVALPECMWQVDVVEGASPTAADGTANYQYQNGKFVDGGLRDFLKGGAGTCEDPEVCPYDETMAKDDPNCVKPEEPETPVEGGTEKPTSLPRTGATVAVFGLGSIAAAVRQLIISRRGLIKASLFNR